MTDHAPEIEMTYEIFFEKEEEKEKEDINESELQDPLQNL